MTYDRYQLESHLTCGQKGHYLQQGIRPRRYLIPYETRRRIETHAPSMLIQTDAKAEAAYIRHLRRNYEKMVGQRGLEVPPEENSYTAFTREAALLTAMLLGVAKRYRAPEARVVNELLNPGVIVGNQFWTFRVVSRWDNPISMVIDQSLSLDALKLADHPVESILVCPIIAGTRKGDHYDNPFCRMFRDETTGSSAWSATFEEGGKTRRLGKQWERIALTEPGEIERWIDAVRDIQRLAGDPWPKVFPTPVRLPLDGQMLERGRWFASQLQMPNQERNYRACLFPSQCEYFQACWMNESTHGPNWIKE